MTTKRFILCMILFMIYAAASYAQGAASHSASGGPAAAATDTIAASPDTVAVSSDTISASSDTTAVSSDTIAAPSDTAATQPAKREKTDAAPSQPTLEKPANAADAKPDTVVKPGKYYGLGAGLSLGSIPLFTLWKDALPDSLSRLGITPSFGRGDTSDTENLNYRTIEAPEEFNVFIPFQLSIYSIKENSSASVGLSFFYNAKQFQAEIIPNNETDRWVNIYETMKFYSISIEASWQAAIPPEYFSLKGSQKTFVSLALGVSPIQYITRYGEAIPTPAKGDARMASVADTAAKNMLPKFFANGASASWRVGISSLKSLTNGNALEMGLYYSGAYSGHFYRDGKKIMNSAIQPIGIGEDETDNPLPDNPLSFFSNRIEFKVTYLIPVKREKIKIQEKPLAEPVRQDDGKDAEAQQEQQKQQLQQDNEKVQDIQQVEQEQLDNPNIIDEEQQEPQEE